MRAELQNLLRETSRSFYLTVRVLPGAIRSQIGLAYLLARATDTIADTTVVPVTERLAALNALREAIDGRMSAPPDLSRFAQEPAGQVAGVPGSASAAERQLLGRTDEIIRLVSTFSPEDQQGIRQVLRIITSGQELDLRRFEGAGEGRIICLPGDAELEDYTYRVAGCVGEFWTEVCRRHLFPRAKMNDATFLADARRFGQGLQLVNILRDLPRDLRQGRCYLPATGLSAAGLNAGDLLNPENASRLRPVYGRWLDAAGAHLAAGWNYTQALPFGQFRVRLACAWPVLIGVHTLARLRTANPLDAGQRVKVSRAEVRSILLHSLLACPFRGAWARQWARAESL